MNTLMLIDDDYEVLTINQKYFQNEGYNVLIFNNALEAIKALDGTSVDCIILDIMMPHIDGMNALPLIRKKSNAPVIFLTGKDNEDDKINGLLSGADDYMIKPYSLKELSARIKVQLRKTIPVVKSNILSFPPLSIDKMQHKAFYNQTEEINISNREYDLLLLFASHPGKTVSFREIGESMWHSFSDDDRKTIMVTTSRLRKKLERYKGLENCIETVYGKGYKFTL